MTQKQTSNATQRIVDLALRLEAERGLPPSAAVLTACECVPASAGAQRLARILLRGARRRLLEVS